MWIARDERGDSLNLFTEKPIRFDCRTPWVDKDGNKKETYVAYEKGSKKCRKYSLDKALYPNITFENSPKEMVLKDDIVDFACFVWDGHLSEHCDINDLQPTNQIKEEITDKFNEYEVQNY